MSQVYVKITSCMYKKGTADQRKKRKKEKKAEEWEYLHRDYIVCKELIKIWIWFDRKWDSSP